MVHVVMANAPKNLCSSSEDDLAIPMIILLLAHQPWDFAFNMHRQLAITRPNNIFKLALEHAVFHLICVYSPCIECSLVINFNGRCTSSSSCSISKQLRLDASVHRTEEEDSRIDGLRCCQDAVVLQDDSLLVSESLGDPTTFFVCKDNAAEGVVDCVVLIEPGSVSASFNFAKHLSTYRQASWLIGSNLHPNALKAFVGLL